MVIHEYQARDLFESYGIPVVSGKVFESLDGIEAALTELDAKFPAADNPDIGGYVVKAQVHAGGRGKGGGVKFSPNKEKALENAKNILGMTLHTPQTPAEGIVVNKILIVPGLEIEKEYYLAIILDRKSQRPVIIASTEGGVDIEEVAEATPEKVVKIAIDPAHDRCWPYYGRKVAEALQIEGKNSRVIGKIVSALYDMFMEKDGSIIEINPLIMTNAGNIYAIDGKVNFDESALFRNPDIAALRDIGEEEPLEVEAAEAGLNYIKLDGTIGCMVNGAGLAMATMDTIALYGGEPANFLDVGGTADAARVEKAFRILMKDPNVKTVLINVFGGIVLCDRVANGVVDAIKNIEGFNMPVVVRLAGTNSDIAKDILRESGLDLIPANDLRDGAEKAVKAASAQA